MTDSGRPPAWQRALALTVSFVVTFVLLVACWVVARLLSYGLTLALGELEAGLTGWTVLLTYLACVLGRERGPRLEKFE